MMDGRRRSLVRPHAATGPLGGAWLVRVLAGLARLLLLALVVNLLAAAAIAQTLVVLADYGFYSLDPVESYDSDHSNLYEGLYGYRRGSANEYEPVLATSYSVSDDGLTYVFHLREGVTFHSGNPFTCADVAYSMKRALVMNPADSGVWVLAEALLGSGANAVEALGSGATDERFAAYWAAIDGSVACPDAMTAVIHVAAAGPATFAKLMVTAGYVVDSEWAKANGEWDGTGATWRAWVGTGVGEHYMSSRASGTGAYRLVSSVAGLSWRFEANRGYWGGAPRIPSVRVRVVQDQGRRVAALLAGDADFIDMWNRSSLGEVAGRPGVRVYDASTNPNLAGRQGTRVLYFNEVVQGPPAFLGSGKLDGLGVPPDFFSDPDARKCFAYSFDPETYMADALGGLGELRSMALPAAFLGEAAGVPAYGLDLAKAEAHCRAAWSGELWERGMVITLPFPIDDDFLLAGEVTLRALKANLELLNDKFEVEVRGVPWGRYYSQLSATPVAVIGDTPAYGDPDALLRSFYASTGAYASSFGYANSEIDALISAAAATYDLAERAELYGRIGRLAYEDAPFIVLPMEADFFVMSDRVYGLGEKPVYPGGWTWKDLSMEE